MFRFNCGEGEIWSNIKTSQNIMTSIVGLQAILFVLKFFRKELNQTHVENID